MEHPENSRNELEPSETKYYNPLLSWKHIKTPTTLKVLIFVGMKISRISLCKKKIDLFICKIKYPWIFFLWNDIRLQSVARVI